MKYSLSIVIPVFNEQSRLAGCFAALINWKSPKQIRLEQVIFIDDGSQDSTKIKIQKSKFEIEKILKTRITIISYKPNRGKGYAIMRGMAASTSDYSLFLDADMATPLTELTTFLPAIKRGADVIVGTRKNGKSTVIRHQPLYREVLGHGFTKIANILLGITVTDFTCGFKAFSREAKDTIFPTLKSWRWGFDAEVIWRAKEASFDIQEVPVRWSDVVGSKVKLVQDIPFTLFELFRLMGQNLSMVNTLNVGKRVRKMLSAST